MPRLRYLYRPLHLRKNYKEINEEEILCKLYDCRVGTLKLVISKLINEAILSHMNLDINSTITQMLELNNYLTSLFIINLYPLIFNYLLQELEDKQIEEIDEDILRRIEELARSADMETELNLLLVTLEEIVNQLEV